MLGGIHRVSAKMPLAPHFLVLPLLFSSFWILYTGFEETMKNFTVNFLPSSIYERMPLLPCCTLLAHKGISVLMQQIMFLGRPFVPQSICTGPLYPNDMKKRRKKCSQTN